MFFRYMDISFSLTPKTALATKGHLTQFSTKTLHAHDCHQILLIKEGVSVFEQEDFTVPQYGRTAAFIPAGIRHRTTVIGDKTTYESLYFHSSFFPAGAAGIRIFAFSELGTALLHRMCDQFYLDLTQPVHQQCFTLFMTVLAEDLPKPVHSLNLPRPKTKEGTIMAEYIRDHFHEPLTLNDFASVLAYSKRHLSRIFKEDFGITLFSYLRLYRILMSTIRIHQSGDSVTNIALDCGYESLSSFYADFSRLMGQPPGEFRGRLT